MKKGCGCTKGILKYIRPPYAKMFYVPCYMHDSEYEIGGDKERRKLADKALFRRMCRVIIEKEQHPLRTLWLTFVALSYYASVRVFGRWYFEFK